MAVAWRNVGIYLGITDPTSPAPDGADQGVPFRSRLKLSLGRDWPLIVFTVVATQVWQAARWYIALAISFGLLILMLAVMTWRVKAAARRKRAPSQLASPSTEERADPR